MDTRGIAPHYGRTIALTCSATEATFALPGNAGGSGNLQILLTNVGTQVVFFRFAAADNTTTTSSADVPVLPNSQRILTCGILTGPFTLRAIAPGGAGSILYITPGMGGV